MEPEETVIFGHSEENVNNDIKKFEAHKREESEGTLYVNNEQRRSMEKLCWSDICRVCANSNDHIIPIFEGEGVQHDLSDKIHKYLPIRVAKTDTLPIQLCYHCAATILAWHELLEGCADAEKQLLQMQFDRNYNEQNKSKYSENLSDGPVDDPESMSIDKQALISIGQQEEETEQGVIEEESTSRSQEEFYGKRDTLTKSIDKSNDILVYDDQMKGACCKICDNSFSQISELVEHMKHIHDDHLYYCHYCKIVFRGPDESFYEHVRNHEYEEQTRNNDESENLLYLSTENDEIKLESNTREICDMPTSRENNDNRKNTKANLPKEGSKVILLDVHHSVPENITYEPSKSPYMCEFCGKTYYSLLNLRTHQRNVHAGLKLHMCDLCERNFALKSTLENHQRSHTKKSPYKCEYCDKKFRTANSMYVHQRIHEDRKLYVCTKCEKRYLTKQCLSEHLRTHEDNTSYVCETCGKSFGFKRNLLRHFRVHSIDETFVCPFCPSKFRQKRYLRVHTQIHHPDK